MYLNYSNGSELTNLSPAYDAALDAARALGSSHAANGQKPQSKGLYGLQKKFYFLGYRA